jgi:hypothetical protein
MFVDAFFNHVFVKRAIATGIDFSIEIAAGFLGGYFGAMVAALVIVLHRVSPMATQKAIWGGMGFGFLFWLITASWVNRVLIQGMSRASIGKRLMNLEIVSNGPAISWAVMMRHWVSGSLMGEVKVVSASDPMEVASVIQLQTKKATSTEGEGEKSGLIFLRFLTFCGNYFSCHLYL